MRNLEKKVSQRPAFDNTDEMNVVKSVSEICDIPVHQDLVDAVLGEGCHYSQLLVEPRIEELLEGIKEIPADTNIAETQKRSLDWYMRAICFGSKKGYAYRCVLPTFFTTKLGARIISVSPADWMKGELACFCVAEEGRHHEDLMYAAQVVIKRRSVAWTQERNTLTHFFPHHEAYFFEDEYYKEVKKPNVEYFDTLEAEVTPFIVNKKTGDFYRVIEEDGITTTLYSDAFEVNREIILKERNSGGNVRIANVYRRCDYLDNGTGHGYGAEALSKLSGEHNIASRYYFVPSPTFHKLGLGDDYIKRQLQKSDCRLSIIGMVNKRPTNGTLLDIFTEFFEKANGAYLRQVNDLVSFCFSERWQEAIENKFTYKELAEIVSRIEFGAAIAIRKEDFSIKNENYL